MNQYLENAKSGHADMALLVGAGNTVELVATGDANRQILRLVSSCGIFEDRQEVSRRR